MISFFLAQANGNDVQIISILLAAFGGLAINLLNLVELQKVGRAIASKTAFSNFGTEG